MISPLIIRVIWLIGAYIVYPIAMISILGSMSQSRYVTAGDMWKTVGISILVLIVFRLFLESLMAIFRIHESSTKTTELMERLVKLKEGRESESQEAGE
jgi:cytochrome b561